MATTAALIVAVAAVMGSSIATLLVVAPWMRVFPRPFARASLAAREIKPQVWKRLK